MPLYYKGKPFRGQLISWPESENKGEPVENKAPEREKIDMSKIVRISSEYAQARWKEIYSVPSARDANYTFLVALDNEGWKCSCAAYWIEGSPDCDHIKAVKAVKKEMEPVEVSEPEVKASRAKLLEID